mgnify:CR=1 FL=1
MEKLIYKLEDQYGHIHRFDLNSYDDRIDANPEISLFEYGIIRQNKTDKVLYWYQIDEYKSESKVENTGHIEIHYIGTRDVMEALERVDNGFYEFIGSTKGNEIAVLLHSQENLSYLIYSLNQWNGWFNS